MNDAYEYIVRDVHRENHDTVSLFLSYRDDTVPSYVPGQFITIYFPELSTPEGKAYSISSAPHEQWLRITVKAIGEFSNRLCDMQHGDTIHASLPYGFFYSEGTITDLLLIAGGIGITPFRSTALHLRHLFPNRSCTILHSIRSERDALFTDTLTNAKITLEHFITREPTSSLAIHTRRIEVQDIISREQIGSSEIFICGSIPFVRDLWRGLKDAGIPEEHLYTEAFFSH